LPETDAEDGNQQRLPDRARNCDVAHAPEVAEGEVEAHAKHEEDDTQLGQLPDGAHIADKPGCEGADGDAGKQVANDGRQAHSPGEQPAQKGQCQCHGDVDQQW